MSPSLSATNVRIPPVPARAVRRPRLFDVLEQGVPEARLAVVSAPAGYGKTTLLAQWARSSQWPVAWMTIDPGGDDLDQFLRALLLAWEGAQPGIRESPAGVLLAAPGPDPGEVATAIVDLALSLPDALALVMDDAHLIGDAGIRRALLDLVDRAPPHLHVVLSCRGSPPLPLAHFRARQELLEIGAGDLQFAEDEAAALLDGVAGLDLDPKEFTTLYGALEGWAAGLQLVAIARRQRGRQLDDLIVTGRHRHLADYFREDVLSGLPDDTRDFLLQTSVLDRLCGPLVDTVCDRTDGQEMLERLERECLFTVSLDDNREWFRYHTLFADYLRDELTRHRPDDLATLHRRAGAWHLDHNLPDQAIDHAIAGDDADLCGQIFLRYLSEKLNTGELRVVRRWLDALPPAWYDATPLFRLAEAGWLLVTGEFGSGMTQLERAEQRIVELGRTDIARQLALVTAVRCFVACEQNAMAEAEAYAAAALRDLAPDAHAFRATIYHALGDTYRRNGRWNEARASYLQVLETSHEPRTHARGAHVHGALADLELMRGRLRRAAVHWDRALIAVEARENWGRVPLPVTGWVYVRIAELHYERNQLATIDSDIARGLDRAERGGDVRTVVAGTITLARLRLAEGDLDAAGQCLDRIRPLVEQMGFTEWIGRFERTQVDLWLAQGQLRTAVDWADASLANGTFAAQADRDMTRLAITRVMVARGDAPSLNRARTLLGDVVEAAEREGRTGNVIEALALRALASERQGDRPGALTSLETALRLAAPEGFVRVFADFGLPMARLLQEARARHVESNYVENLLQAFRVTLSPGLATSQVIPEPLSHREREVVRLIAAGLTNHEIADALYISPETVKKHVGSVFGKLGVSNRTSAAARARDLGLLDQAGS